MIRFISLGVKTPLFLAKKPLKVALRFLIEKEGKTSGDISVVFTDDAYLLEVNKQFLNHDYYTDVVTFDYCEGNLVSGDVLISLDRVKENAGVAGVSFQNELSRVVFHGVLHLCGYKDKSAADVKVMRRKEDECLRALVSRETKQTKK